jgi:hypothetical protein
MASVMYKSRINPSCLLVVTALVALGLFASLTMWLQNIASREAQRHGTPIASRSSNATTPSATAVDFSSLIDLLEADRKANGESSNNLSLILGSGQTVHEQFVWQNWWYWLLDYWHNGSQSLETFP